MKPWLVTTMILALSGRAELPIPDKTFSIDTVLEGPQSVYTPLLLDLVTHWKKKSQSR